MTEASAMGRMRELGGLVRSLAIYHGLPSRGRAREAFYGEFVRPGDLCFDIGAHAGNHVRTLRRLGARVVAVEPQPRFAALLRRMTAGDPEVVVVEQAVGASPGQADLHLSAATPTVATLSADWMAAVRKAKSFRKVAWEQTLSVEVTTLDALIAIHGLPGFCKIDVEGLEAEVLSGLSQAIQRLSFEYLPAARDVAFAALDRVVALGDNVFNVCVGETLRFEFADWCDAATLRGWLARRAIDDRSGDVHCRLKD